jgi:hypothetical protein
MRALMPKSSRSLPAGQQTGRSTDDVIRTLGLFLLTFGTGDGTMPPRQAVFGRPSSSHPEFAANPAFGGEGASSSLLADFSVSPGSSRGPPESSTNVSGCEVGAGRADSIRPPESKKIPRRINHCDC